MNTKLPPNKHVHCKAHMNCPQCNDKGLSVASLHQREFIISEKKGEFSGAGLGLGLNGVSLGVGLGAYEENGTNTTKRAMIFSEPRPPEQISEGVSLNFLSNLCLNLLLLLALFQASEFLGFTNSSNVNIDAGVNLAHQIYTFLNPYMGFIVISLVVIGYYSFLFTKGHTEVNETVLLENNRRLDRFNNKLERYNNMRYCEHCHLLYNNSLNISEIANQAGFDRMLSN